MKIDVKDALTGEWITVTKKNTTLMPKSRWILRKLVEHNHSLNDDFNIEYSYDTGRVLKVTVTMNDDTVMLLWPFFGMPENRIPDSELQLWREHKTIEYK